MLQCSGFGPGQLLSTSFFGVSSQPLTNVFASLFRRFIVLLKFLPSKWQTWLNQRPPSSNPGSSDGLRVESGDQASERLKQVHVTNVDQMVIPLDNVSCSLYPYGTGLDASRSSQMLRASRSSHDLDIASRSRNTSWSSHNVGSGSPLQSPIGDGYTFRVETTSPRLTYPMSPPELGRPRTADLHEAILQRRPRTPQIFQQPRSASPVESIQLLSQGANPRSPVPISPSSASTEQSSSLGAVGTASQVHFLSDDLEIPALGHDRIYPVVPENFQRYEKRRRIPEKATRVKLKPMVTDFSGCSDPAGWSRCTHPEGACYFYNAEKRIFTDVDLYDSAFFKRIVRHIEIIQTFIDNNHIPIPEETDLVLDINLDDNGTYVTDYYFANHQRRIIFFLDHFSTEYLPNWEEIKGVNSGRHLQHEIETQYWWHCSSYPNSIQLTDDLICELRDNVMHCIGDNMTSPYATSPFTLDDLYKILSLADGLKENVGKPYSGCTSLLCRFMSIFSHMKFLNFYGQPEARLNRDQSVYGKRTNRRTWLIKTISILLFSAPDVNLKTLQKMWVDGIMHKAVWEASLKRLNDEWQEFILYATVLLNANVAFLGIQSVDSDHGSPAQISSYCSIVTSIGSIILGLLLVRQNQTKNRETVDEAQRFLRNKAHPLLGLEILAILFSLPYALLMWSMVSFLSAFLFMCFQGSSIVTRSVIGPLCAVIAVLIAWCIWTSWEKQPASDAEEPEKLLSFEEENPEERSKKFTFEVVIPEYTDSEECQHSALGLRLPLSFTWPAFLNRQRES